MTVKELYEEFGADYNDLMTRIPMENMIERFVKKFIDSAKVSELEEAFASSNYEQVFASAHNLKGMSANLSLTPICESATIICEATRHGAPEQDLSPYVTKIRSDYEALVVLVSKLG